MFDYLHLQTCKQCLGQVAYFITVQCADTLNCSQAILQSNNKVWMDIGTTEQYVAVLV